MPFIYHQALRILSQVLLFIQNGFGFVSFLQKKNLRKRGTNGHENRKIDEKIPKKENVSTHVSY
jgi:hypothetical protein